MPKQKRTYGYKQPKSKRKLAKTGGLLQKAKEKQEGK